MGGKKRDKYVCVGGNPLPGFVTHGRSRLSVTDLGGLKGTVAIGSNLDPQLVSNQKNDFPNKGFLGLTPILSHPTSR